MRNAGMGRRVCRTLALCLAICMMGISIGMMAGCSDQVLEPGGTIRPSANGTTAPEATAAPGDTAAVPGGAITLEIATEKTTAPSMSIGDGEDPYQNANHRMYVDFLNTGESDCILIRMDDKVVLIDTGETDDYATIRKHLSDTGVSSIDYLILTHFDNDHIGTVTSVLEDYPVGTVYMPDYIRDSRLYRNMMEALNKDSCTAEVHRLYAQDIDLDFGFGRLWINATALEQHAPGQTLGADQDNDANEENDFSLMTTVTFGNVRLILTGDAEQARMNEFLPLCTARNITSCDLMKIPHHGRSDDKALLSALGTLLPRYCIICTDSENHVAGALTTRMKAIGAGRYYTCNGGITLATDGTSVTMIQKSS